MAGRRSDPPGREAKSAGRSDKSSAGANRILGGANRFLGRNDEHFRRSNQVFGGAATLSARAASSRPSARMFWNRTEPRTYDRTATFTRERRLAACARTNPDQFTILSLPSIIRPFPSSITLQRRTALAYALLAIVPARAHLHRAAIFRPRHQCRDRDAGRHPATPAFSAASRVRQRRA